LYRRYLIDFGSSVSTARSIRARQKPGSSSRVFSGKAAERNEAQTATVQWAKFGFEIQIIITFVYFVRFMVSYPE
jgi:hypothetical protein